MSRTSAIAAAGVLAASATSASAADLGGNCCADLEERIAELEATTARKGNRKVSLTISGWVAEQVVWWDDGVESNVYVGGIGTTLASHFKLTGSARFLPGWSAGYVLHIEGRSNEPQSWSQETSGEPALPVNLLQSFWFIKSDTLGKVSVGLQSQASDNTAILVDGSGSLVPANWELFDGANFGLRVNGALVGATWGGTLGVCQHTGLGIGGDCNGVPLNAVRYDSPTFGGFSVSASWGEDDFWDVAARYAGEAAGFKLAVAAAYSEMTDENDFGNPLPALLRHKDSEYFQIGAYLQHVPTGLFVYGAYGHEDTSWDFQPNPLVASTSHDDDHWYVKAGIRQRWTPLGHTVLYGEYGELNDMLPESFTAVEDLVNAAAPGTNARISSNMQRWGLGIVQEIDAAAMSIWLKYRHHEGDIDFRTSAGAASINFDDMEFVGMGALINF